MPEKRGISRVLQYGGDGLWPVVSIAVDGCILPVLFGFGGAQEFKILDDDSGIGRIGANLSINLTEDFKMKLFRSATIAVALVIPFGLAQAATSNTPPPPPNTN